MCVHYVRREYLRTHFRVRTHAGARDQDFVPETYAKTNKKKHTRTHVRSPAQMSRVHTRTRSKIPRVRAYTNRDRSPPRQVSWTQTKYRIRIPLAHAYNIPPQRVCMRPQGATLEVYTQYITRTCWTCYTARACARVCASSTRERTQKTTHTHDRDRTHPANNAAQCAQRTGINGRAHTHKHTRERVDIAPSYLERDANRRSSWNFARAPWNGITS